MTGFTQKPLPGYWKNTLALIGCSETEKHLFYRILVRSEPELVQNLQFGPNEYSPWILEARKFYLECKPLLDYILGDEAL
jgi:hypothetical protein